MKKAGNTPPIQIKSSFRLPPPLLDFYVPLITRFSEAWEGGRVQVSEMHLTDDPPATQTKTNGSTMSASDGQSISTSQL